MKALRAFSRHASWPVVMLSAFVALGCMRTTGVTLGASPNPNAVFVCTPTTDLAQMTCQSGQAFNTGDRPFDLAKQIEAECDFGVAKVWIESKKNGRVTRVQFQCALQPIEEAPAEPAPPRPALVPTYQHAEPAP